MKEILKYFVILLILNACSSDQAQTSSEQTNGRNLTITDFKKIGKLQIKLSEPNPGEWLYSHKEKGQSYSAYRQQNPVRPTNSLNKICILPLGKFSNMEQKLLKATAEYVSTFFTLDVELLGAIPDKVVPKKSRRMNSYGEQLHTKFILDSVLLPNIPANVICFISITNKDLYPADDWNYVFGQAYLTKRTGVSSYRRYFDNQLDSSNYQQCLERTIKTTTHELCHMFSIKHCRIYKCLLNGSNHMQEADSKPLWLCPECLAKLQWCIKFDLFERYDNLIKYFSKQKFTEPKQYYQRSKQLMKS